MKEDDDEDLLPNISDTQITEIMKALTEDKGVGSDWEIVFHDVPIKSSENEADCYAISG